MDESHRLIASFVIDAGHGIRAQGRFQVLAEPGFRTGVSSDGVSFFFEHAYRGPSVSSRCPAGGDAQSSVVVFWRSP